MENFLPLLNKLHAQGSLEKEEWCALFSQYDNDALRRTAAEMAQQITLERFGNGIFVRGIIEFSNYCVNDCLYCGIRRSNKNAERYRLSENEILECCRAGFDYGFRTFVLQSGEDRFWSCGRLCALVNRIKCSFPECAVTLSVGELTEKEYRQLYEAGADRYLLRHESASSEHFSMIHPVQQTLDSRMQCLRALKRVGFQTGCGFMVGTPGQTFEHLAEDMLFISEFRPHMVGIGPFIPHCETPFGNCSAGSVELTLLLLSLCRIMFPDLLLPATTALGTLLPGGRIEGILAGANVIMPNISPMEIRSKYSLYNNKNSADPGNAGVLHSDLQQQLAAVGRQIVIGRGDYGERLC